jgi:hypothetical protein
LDGDPQEAGGFDGDGQTLIECRATGLDLPNPMLEFITFTPSSASLAVPCAMWNAWQSRKFQEG